MPHVNLQPLMIGELVVVVVVVVLILAGGGV